MHVRRCLVTMQEGIDGRGGRRPCLEWRERKVRSPSCPSSLAPTQSIPWLTGEVFFVPRCASRRRKSFENNEPHPSAEALLPFLEAATEVISPGWRTLTGDGQLCVVRP